MPTNCRHEILVVGVVLAWVALAFCLGEHGAAYPTAEPQAPAKGGPTPLYYGAVPTCSGAGCHSSPPDTNKVYVCACTEYQKWNQEDKHKIAYEVLLTDRAKKMGELLQYRVPVSEHEACLSCHSVVIKDAKLAHESFKREEGVTCVVCHGAYEEWVDLHGSSLKREKWRAYSHEDKEKRFGMTDLWKPARRAALCASCHIGELKPGEPARFVTHEMYAAGHPPLPGFEAATFNDQMPRHWQYLREKTAGVQKMLGYDGSGQEQTKLVLVSAAVSLRESMRLLSRQAAECDRAVDPDQRTLNLANFDCYACHHELQSPSWRRARGYPGKPGRVPIRSWPIALMKLAIRHAAGDTEAREMEKAFQEKLRRLQAAFDDRPFGDPKQIAPAADDLTSWANALAERLDKRPYNRSAARKLLAQLPSLWEEGVPDYDSARQIAWAIQVIAQEVGEHDPHILKIFAKQDSILQLHLPAGQERDIRRELKQGLTRRNNYDPDKFKETLQALAKYFNGKIPAETAR